MSYNGAKLLIVGVLALALIVVTAVVAGSNIWTVPLLGLLVGYIVGNAEVTNRTGLPAPIVSTRRD